MTYESMDAIQIGNKLRELRESHDQTLEEAANDLGISKSAICMYETGNRIPKDEIKIRIAEYYHVPLESIFFPTKQHET